MTKHISLSWRSGRLVILPISHVMLVQSARRQILHLNEEPGWN